MATLRARGGEGRDSALLGPSGSEAAAPPPKVNYRRPALYVFLLLGWAWITILNVLAGDFIDALMSAAGFLVTMKIIDETKS